MLINKSINEAIQNPAKHVSANGEFSSKDQRIIQTIVALSSATFSINSLSLDSEGKWIFRSLLFVQARGACTWFIYLQLNPFFILIQPLSQPYLRLSTPHHYCLIQQRQNEVRHALAINEADPPPLQSHPAMHTPSYLSIATQLVATSCIYSYKIASNWSLSM
jgi:hypothetical protein